MPAQSVSEQVGDLARAAVDALGLTKPGSDPATPVPSVKRKTPAVPEGDTLGLPQVVVSVGAEGSVEPIDATTDLIGYPVAVTIVTAGGAKAGDDATVRQWRQQIRRAVQDRAGWSDLAGWNAVETVGKEPFDASALSKDFNFSTQVFTVFVLEPRT